jgi:hypothetical protein
VSHPYRSFLIFSRSRKKKARFNGDEDKDIDYSCLQQVEDICRSLVSPSPDQRDCLGFVLDENLKFRGTYTVDRDLRVEIDQNCTSLEELLSHTPKSINRSTALNKRESLCLAVNLASSLLQLHTTPWLPENWCNKSIYFSRPVNVQQPYVMIKFGKSPTPPDSQTSFVLNPYLVSLGIILLELSERKSFLEWISRRGDTSLPDNVMGKAIVAWEWFEEAYWNMSEEYAIAVQHCLKSSFTPVQPKRVLADEGFREAVYRDIVHRLQREYFIFTNPIKVSTS